jgi:hypothetical protein
MLIILHLVQNHIVVLRVKKIKVEGLGKGIKEGKFWSYI